jgi:hypothetical protein
MFLLRIIREIFLDEVDKDFWKFVISIFAQAQLVILS